MKKKFIKRLPIALISGAILLAGYVIGKACGWSGDWEDGYYSNYSPETFASTAYKPFFYSDMFYYDIKFDNRHLTRFNDENTKEWKGYLGNDLDSSDISFLLTKAGLSTIEQSKQETPRQKAFVAYLKTAKACERYAATEPLSWYEAEADQPKAKPHNIDAPFLESAMKNSKETFIKERYWFQLVRYNFFFAPASCIAAFELNKRDFDHNTMYYRTMAYAAGAYYKQKNYAKANYYYSLVFSGSDALKTVAHWSFHPQEEADWNATLNLCSDKDEKATLWQMLGIFYGDEKRSIDEIYKLNPKSRTMDILLGRIINQIETTGKPDKKQVALIYSWCRKIADEQKTGNPFLWNITTGYLAYMTDDYKTADSYYDKAEHYLPSAQLAKEQLRLMRLLTYVGLLDKIDAAIEAKLFPELDWLYFDNNKTKELRTIQANAITRAVLAKKYEEQQDWIKSECFVSTPGFYTNKRHINDLIIFLDKNKTGAFENLCKKISEKKQDDLWEYLAIDAAYNDRIKESITLMNKSTGAKNIELYGNPFNARINDCHDCDHAMKQKTKYSKLNLLLKLQEMEGKISRNEDVYNNALLLGNAFYNMSYFGNARHFYEGKVIGEGFNSVTDIDSAFLKPLTEMGTTKKYYQLAFTHAGNDEQKAKCLYLISKCERNEWYNATLNSATIDPYYSDRTVDFIKWNSFNTLAAYKNTQYYNDVIQECGYFRTSMKQ